jgi:DNA-binding MarR family transcriptional regulator
MISKATHMPTEIAEELRPIFVRAGRELRRETETLGVTTRQVTLLWRVRSSPGLSLRELAAAEGISAPALSDHVDRLEALDFVARVRSSADRRRVGLVVTAAGEALLRRVRSRRTTWLTTRLAALDPDEIDAIVEALPALRRLVDEVDA